jgi:hypothetical protein
VVVVEPAAVFDAPDARVVPDDFELLLEHAAAAAATADAARKLRRVMVR